MLRRARSESSIPMASMADIAFLLLVFFLVTTHFLEEKGLGMVLPDPWAIGHPPHRKNVVYLKVLGADDVVMIHQDEELRIPTARIGGPIQRKLAENPFLMVSLRSAPDSPYGAMIDVLDELRVANARRISVGLLEDR